MPVEDFAGHGVDGVGYAVTLRLRDFGKALALGEVAADDTVVAFV